MVDTTRTEPASFTIPVGFHAPGVLAVSMYKAVEDGQTCEQATERLREPQPEMTDTCPACGRTWQIELFDEPTSAELYSLASRLEYCDFLAEIEKRYAAFKATCPTCGVQGPFAAETLGECERVAA